MNLLCLYVVKIFARSYIYRKVTINILVDQNKIC